MKRIAAILGAVFVVAVAIIVTWVSSRDVPGSERVTTRLHMAVYSGDLRKLKAALKRGEDVSARDKLGRTALCVAADPSFGC